MKRWTSRNVFSTNDSGKFVNGILDSVKAELLRPAREVK
jgi:transcription termination factor NusB